MAILSHTLTAGAAPRRRSSTILPLLFVLPTLLLAGCEWILHPFGGGTPERYYALYSPNGEPLSGGPLGRPKCEDALGGWYDRLAATHGGTVDLAAYLADTRRQFAAMDLDHDGTLNPAELSEYRAPYAVDARPASQARPGDPKSRRPEDGGIASDRPDPVMIADAGLRNEVTLADFLAYETRKFNDLNTSRTGMLRREEVLAMCKSSR